MKYLVIIISSFVFFFLGCNENTQKAADAKSDTLVYAYDSGKAAVATTVAPDSVSPLKTVNDSFNIAIDKMDEVIKDLADSALKTSGDKRKEILGQRSSVTDARSAIAQMRDNVTVAAIKGLTTKLITVVNSLKSSLLKLQKISEKIDRIVSIMGFVDKTLGSAMAAGIIKPPVVIPEPVAN